MFKDTASKSPPTRSPYWRCRGGSETSPSHHRASSHPPPPPQFWEDHLAGPGLRARQLSLRSVLTPLGMPTRKCLTTSEHRTLRPEVFNNLVFSLWNSSVSFNVRADFYSKTLDIFIHGNVFPIWINEIKTIGGDWVVRWFPKINIVDSCEMKSYKMLRDFLI